MVSLFGKKKNMERELELLQLKESMVFDTLKNTKPEPKQVPVSEKEQFIETIMKKISEYVEKEIAVRLKEAESKKNEAIIKAKTEQFEADIMINQTEQKALKQAILSVIDEQVKDAGRQNDGAMALAYLGEIRRKVENI